MLTLEELEKLNPGPGRWPYVLTWIFQEKFLDHADNVIDAELSSRQDTYSYMTALRVTKPDARTLRRVEDMVRASLYRNELDVLVRRSCTQCLAWSFLTAYLESINGKQVSTANPSA